MMSRKATMSVRMITECLVENRVMVRTPSAAQDLAILTG